MNEGHEEKRHGWWRRVKGRWAIEVGRDVLKTVRLAKDLWEIGEWVKEVSHLLVGG